MGRGKEWVGRRSLQALLGSRAKEIELGGNTPGGSPSPLNFVFIFNNYFNLFNKFSVFHSTSDGSDPVNMPRGGK